VRRAGEERRCLRGREVREFRPRSQAGIVQGFSTPLLPLILLLTNSRAMMATG
jgi:hypothetical protein